MGLQTWPPYGGGPFIEVQLHVSQNKGQFIEVAELQRWSSYRGGRFGRFYCILLNSVVD